VLAGVRRAASRRARATTKALEAGPCPPIGRHRYFFKLYALDRAVDAGGLDKAGLIKAIDGHVLARGELIGTYQKKR
jgi:phosphatidylethanolamine-binding protein (PEBP) family uncharacterized protein